MKSNVLVGIVTFGNTQFSKLTIESILETAGTPLDFYAIVGKPGDTATIEMLDNFNIPYKIHDINYGFPYSLNDIYDYAFKKNSYSAILSVGNDVIAYPYAVDSLIKAAETTHYEWISSVPLTEEALIHKFPLDTKEYFKGANRIFTDFTARPWDLYREYAEDGIIIDNSILNTHDLCLYKREVFDRIGYIDVNFFPAYFEDNDYITRGVREGIPHCTVSNAVHFHFRSRTIKQETGGSNDRYFRANQNFYKTKWGSSPHMEKYLLPFDGREYQLGNVTLQPKLNIQSRDQEIDIINYWKGKVRE